MGLSISLPFTLLFVFSFLVFSSLSFFLCSLPSLFLVTINMIHATVAFSPGGFALHQGNG